MNASANNLFEIQNTLFLFGKICGGICYSNLTKFDVVLTIIRLLIYTTLAFMNFLYLNTYLDQSYYPTLLVASYIPVLLCTIFIPIYFIHHIISRTKILDIWYNINNTCSLTRIKTSNFIFINYFLNYSLLGFCIYYALICVFDKFFIPEFFIFSVYSSFYNIIVMGMQFQIIAMLLVAQKICKKFNFNLNNLYLKKSAREEIKQILKTQFSVHYELFEIFRNIKNLFLSFVFKFLYIFVSVGLNLLLLAYNIKYEQNKIPLLDVLFWTLGDSVGMIYIISSVEIVKCEVLL